MLIMLETIHNNKKYNKYIWFSLGALLGIFVIIMMLLFRIPFTVMIRFVFLNVISIFLPGITALSIFQIRLTRTASVCYAYALGTIFVIMEFFFSEIFDRKIPFIAVTVCVAIFCCIFLLDQKKKGEKIIQFSYAEGELVSFLFLTIFLCLSIFSYSAKCVNPNVEKFFFMHRDMQYWCNNTVALKIAFPPTNLFMSGNSLNYHYFSNIPIAFLSEVYNIDVFTLSIPLYSCTKAFIMTGAALFLLDTIEASPSLRIWGGILILFTTGIEYVAVVTFLAHTLLQPFGFDIGFAYGIYFITTCIIQWKKETFDTRIFVLTLLFWFACVGAKTPLAAVLLLFPACLCLYWLFDKKFKLSLGYGIAILIIFLGIAKFCVGMFSVIKGDGAWSLSLYSTSNIMTLQGVDSQRAYEVLLANIGRSNLFLAIIMKCLLMQPILFFGTLFSIVVMIIYRKRNFTKTELVLQGALYLTALFGITLGIMVNAGGHSEMYFSMAAYIPLYVAIFVAVRKWNASNNTSMKIYKMTRYMINICGWGLLLIGMHQYFLISYTGDGALGALCTGVKKVVFQNSYIPSSDEIADGVCKEDVEALQWIRDNTEKNSLIITDRAVMTENAGFYMYGIFCERQQYLEGTNMLTLAGDSVQDEILRRKELIYDVYNNESAALEQVKEEGVDYIVQTINVTPQFEGDTDSLELVASSETINIYRVK